MIWDEILDAEKIGTEYIQKCAEKVARTAREFCPKEDTELRDSIYYSCDGMYAEIGTDLERAAAVEFGTRNVPPTPFLTRALYLRGDSID